jgi:prevent-host-death family protein
MAEADKMTTKTVDSNQARNNWREMLDTVASRQMDVVITRYNKPVATMLNYEDYLAVRDELVRQRARRQAYRQLRDEATATMYASERVLAREWATPEEDEAWQDSLG